MNFIDTYIKLRQKVPAHVSIVVVTKFQDIERIQSLYDVGHCDFGENRVQELMRKQPHLPSDIRWHMIGHLQTNKVKYIAPFIHLIHSVDSLKLLLEIDKQARKCNRIINCLLQFHIADEETKYGLTLNEACSILESNEYKMCEHIRICGVMGMATLTDNYEQIRKEFRSLVHIFKTLKNTYFTHADFFSEISMGMSSDYQIALEEGSTMLRIGSLIFQQQ